MPDASTRLFIYTPNGVQIPGVMAMQVGPVHVDARFLHWGYQHVGILEPTQSLASGVICVTPDANPRRQSVEYRWRWVFWRLPCIFHVYFMYISCIFHVVCASFSALATRELANAKAVFSGIWA